ncbi:MAG: LamG-like jellyroll fold domain-containing protein, partial [Patescibacteria group bacterium]
MAYDFDGTDDFVTVTKATPAVDLSVFSIAFWLWCDSTATVNRNVYWSGGAWEFTFHSFLQTHSGGAQAGLLHFKTDWSTTHGSWSIATAPPGSWELHVITYDFSATTNYPVWYRNGASVTVTERNTPSGSSNAGQDSTNLRIGAGHDGTYERWDGRVAEFAWWNRILTAGEAAILGKAYSPLFVPNGLVLYTPLVRATFDLKGG